MRYFLDNNIAIRYADGIRAFGGFSREEVVHLREKFDPNGATPDVDWIRALGADGDWVIVSGDIRITRNAAERRAWIESGLTAFFFCAPWQNDSHWAQAEGIVRWWSVIEEQARRTPRGRGFLMPKGGRKLKPCYP